MPHAHQGSPPRRQPRARAADAGQPGHVAVRARQDHHDRDQGQAAAAARRAADHQGQAGRPARPPPGADGDPGQGRGATRCSHEIGPRFADRDRWLHPDHQDRPAQGRQRADGRHRAGRGADRGRGGRRGGDGARPVKAGRARTGGRGAAPAEDAATRRGRRPRRRRRRPTRRAATADDARTRPPTTDEVTERRPTSTQHDAADAAERPTLPTPRSDADGRGGRRTAVAERSTPSRPTTTRTPPARPDVPAPCDDEPVAPVRDGGLVRAPARRSPTTATDFSGWAAQPGRRTVAGRARPRRWPGCCGRRSR